jgi:hypothetical protein
MAYTERLYPSPGVVAACLAFAAGIGVVVLPLGTPIAAGTFVVAVSVLAALLVRSSATVSVAATADGATFTAGPARLPLGVVGDVEALDGEQMRHARGRGLDARAYLCLRGWVATGVRVHLRDPADPAPYWLVSSRHPAALAAALSAAARSATE